MLVQLLLGLFGLGFSLLLALGRVIGSLLCVRLTLLRRGCFVSSGVSGSFLVLARVLLHHLPAHVVETLFTERLEALCGFLLRSFFFLGARRRLDAVFFHQLIGALLLQPVGPCLTRLSFLFLHTTGRFAAGFFNGLALQPLLFGLGDQFRRRRVRPILSRALKSRLGGSLGAALNILRRHRRARWPRLARLIHLIHRDALVR